MATIKGTKKGESLLGTLLSDILLGLAGNDTLKGGNGNDRLDGGADNDKLYGGAGNDTLLGGAGNDTLNGGLGRDNIYGGSGIDTAVFAGKHTAYVITRIANALRVVGPDGVDTVRGDVERLKFSDGVFAVGGEAPIAVDDVNTASASGPAVNGASVLSNDTDQQVKLGIEKLSVSKVEGSSANVGAAIVLASGALLTMNANGTYTYNPNGAFNDVLIGSTGTDTFSYEVSDGRGGVDTGQVTVTIAGTAKSYILTTGADTAPAFTGTSGNDIYTGSILTGNSFVSTFFSNDNLDGAGGTGDELRISIAGTNGGDTISGSILANIETVSIQNVETTGQVTLNAALWSGVTKIVANASASGTSTFISNLATLATAEMKNNAGDLHLNYGTGVLTGGSDTQTLLLSSNLGGTFFTNGTGTAETLNIVSQTAANKVTIGAGNAHTAINVSGNQSLDIDLDGTTSLASFNAAAMTGGGVIVSDLGASNLTFTGSNFNDVVLIAASIFNASDTLGGGGGSDTLVITDGNAVADSAFTHVSSFELLTSAFAPSVNTGLNVTLGTNAQTSGIATVTSGSASADNIILQAGFTGPLTVNIGGGNDTVDASLSTADITLNANVSNVTAGDTLIGGSDLGDTLNLTADGGAAVLTNVSGFETLNVIANGASGAAITLGANSVGAAGTLIVNAATLGTSAALTLDASNLAAPNSVTVNAGAGADILTGGAGIDALFGGAGNDTFKTTVARLTAPTPDTMDGGTDTTGDILEVTDTGTIADSAFANTSNIEILKFDAGGTTATLGANAFHSGTGFNRVIGTTGVDTVTIAAGFTGAITVDISDASGTGGVDSITAGGSTATLTVVANVNDITTDALTGGTGLGDDLRLTADGGTATLTNVTGFETVTVLAGSPASSTAAITTADATVGAGQTLTVDAMALTDPAATLTFDGSAETNGAFNVLGGAGADDLTGGAGDDFISGGAGNDTITGGAGVDSLFGGLGNDTFLTTVADLLAVDTMDGGAHTTGDILEVLNAGTITDGAFANTTNIEILKLDAVGSTVTLGTNAFHGGSGFNEVFGTNGVDTVTIAAGFTSAITVHIGGGVDSVSAAGSAATLTVAASASDITTDTLTGGTGLLDTLALIADNGTATLTNVTGFEKITVLADTTPTHTIGITTVDATVTSGQTLTVDATALTNSAAALSFDGALETNGVFNVTGGAGNDILVGGAGADTLNGGAGNDDITGGIGNDIINAGTGMDVVHSGIGNDTIDLGADSVEDTLAFNLMSTVTGLATVTNFHAAEDIFQVSTGASAWVDGTSNAAPGVEVRASTAGGAVNASLVVLDNATYAGLSDATLAADNLQAGSAHPGESYLFVWGDTGGVTHVSYAVVDGGPDTFLDSSVDLAKLAGVSIFNVTANDILLLT